MPEEQVAQADAPEAAWKVPGSHIWQLDEDEAPTTGFMLPARHPAQPVDPAADWYVPTPHGAHDDALDEAA